MVPASFLNLSGLPAHGTCFIYIENKAFLSTTGFFSDEFLGFSQNLEVAGYPPSDKTRDIDLRCACLLFLD